MNESNLNFEEILRTAFAAFVVSLAVAIPSASLGLVIYYVNFWMEN